MKTRHLALFAFVILPIAGRLHAETFDEAMARASLDYNERLRKAADELNRTRERIASEKAPLLLRMRAAEDRLIAAESETTRFETAQENTAEQRRLLLKELDGVRKHTNYIATLAQESLKAFTDTFAPGEEQLVSDRVQSLHQRLDDIAAGPNGRAASDIADFLLERTRLALGGYGAKGNAVAAGNHSVLQGTFAFVGPETYFRPGQGGWVGTVRSRAGTPLPVAYELPAWNPEGAAAFFEGRSGTIFADVTGGKALRLKETSGSLWDHIKKGGVVAFAITIVGFVSLLTIGQKIRDLAQMGVDAPAAVEKFLRPVAAGASGEARRLLDGLKATTRELFATGLEHEDQPRAILEEQLQAVLLRQRHHFERRLPLLAVIATAAPLMGLLGTVIGMVKTFALITVFGTGNAGKLSSGISEVLVATELGLIVAIPTLIAHGFLAYRTQKNLSLLERYALRFVTAVRTAKARAGNEGSAEDREEPVPA